MSSNFREFLRESDPPDWLKVLYALVFLGTFVHAMLTWDAWTCCPPAYGESAKFVHAVQAAAGWTAATASLMEVITAMVFLAPKVYRIIKEKGIAEGVERGRSEGREEGIAEGMERGRSVGKSEGIAEGMERGRSAGREEGRSEGRAEGRSAGKFEGVDATLEAMREAGFDEDARRRVEDILARRAWRNGGL